MKSINVLVTTMGGIEKYEIYKILKEFDFVNSVVCCDAASNHITDSYEYFEIVPFANADNYRSELARICTKHSISHIISIDTYENIVIADMLKKRELKDIKFSGSLNLDPTVHLRKGDYFSMLDDKFLILDDSLSSEERSVEFDKFITSFVVKDYTKFVIKPNDSHGSRGLKVLDVNYTVEQYYNSKSPYFCSIREAMDIVKSKEELIIQPFYGGQNYNIDCYYSNNMQRLFIVPQRILGNRWGQVLGSEIVTKDDATYETALDWAKVISGTLNLNGNFNFELSLDEVTGKLELVEVNPRVSAVYPQTHYSGVDLIKIFLLDDQEEFHDLIREMKLKHKTLQSVLLTI